MRISTLLIALAFIFSSCEKSPEEEYDARTVSVRFEVSVQGTTTLEYDINGSVQSADVSGDWSATENVPLTWSDQNEFVNCRVNVGAGVSVAQITLYVDGAISEEKEWLSGMGGNSIQVFKEIK